MFFSNIHVPWESVSRSISFSYDTVVISEQLSVREAQVQSRRLGRGGSGGGLPPPVPRGAPLPPVPGRLPIPVPSAPGAAVGRG